MSRPKYITSSDGFSCVDDMIPRSSPNGAAAMDAFLGHGGIRVACLDDRKISKLPPGTKAYIDRVLDAKKRLKRGESRSDVRQIHGRVVLRDAESL